MNYPILPSELWPARVNQVEERWRDIEYKEQLTEKHREWWFNSFWENGPFSQKVAGSYAN